MRNALTLSGVLKTPGIMGNMFMRDADVYSTDVYRNCTRCPAQTQALALTTTDNIVSLPQQYVCVTMCDMYDN